MTNDPKQALLSNREAARFLGISAGTLAVWRSTRRYCIPYTLIGNRPRYSYEDLKQFLTPLRVGSFREKKQVGAGARHAPDGLDEEPKSGGMQPEITERASKEKRKRPKEKRTRMTPCLLSGFCFLIKKTA